MLARLVASDAVFRALADPTRRAILDGLRAGHQPVGQIARSFAVSRPAVWKHLRVLREAGLVIERKQGRQRLCQIDAGPLIGVEAWLNHYRRFWGGRLQRLKEHVEKTR